MELSKDDFKFIMNVGTQIKKYLLTELTTHYADNEDKMKFVFMNTLLNTTANILNDVSESDKFQENLKSLIKGLSEFGKENSPFLVNYNSMTDEMIGVQ